MFSRNILSCSFAFALLAAPLFIFLNQTAAMAGNPGSFDSSFGGAGFVTTATERQFSQGFAVATQPDGKIVVAGRHSVFSSNPADEGLVIRYNANGSLDTSFGGNGKATIGLTGLRVSFSSVALQPDGKIVAVGDAYAIPNSSMFIARFTATGQLDTTFNAIGFMKLSLSPYHGDSASAVKIQPDGKIVVGGCSYTLSISNYNYDLVVLRLHEDGQFDTSFNGSGYSMAHVTEGQDNSESMTLQDDGKIILVGSGRSGSDTDFIAVRFNTDGSLDQTFNGTGFVVTPVGTGDDMGRGVAVQPDGKIVVTGDAMDSVSRMALVRYNADGSLDTSFTGTGKLISPIGLTASGWSVVAQADGKVVVVGERKEGTKYDLLISRYNSDGSADLSFNGTGYAAPQIQNGSHAYGLTLQRDGRILVTGYADRHVGGNLYQDVLVARYLATSPPTAFDFDGDGKADVSTFRPSTGEWYLLRSQAGLYGVSFGAAGDKIAPADYDGDGKTDIAVYRPSNNVWYVLNSGNSTVSYNVFGAAEDLPTPADYDGDGKADLSVFRPSDGTWYRLNSHDNSFFAFQFGQNGDKPALGDYDGDGKADISIYRPADGTWYRINSGDGTLFGTQFGSTGDLHVPADYDGDGKTEVSVFRPSNGVWYRLNSANGAFVAQQFGLSGDVPAPGDFEGDGKTDVCVFRPSDGNWYRLNSSNNAFVAQPFGANGDLPTPAAFR